MSSHLLLNSADYGNNLKGMGAIISAASIQIFNKYKVKKKTYIQTARK